MNIKKGDKVRITAGNDKGKEGEVIKINKDKQRITVDGVNVYKKHVRAKQQGEKGEIVEVPRSIHHSNVLLICPKCGKPTKISKSKKGKEKERICKKCKGLIK